MNTYERKQFEEIFTEHAKRAAEEHLAQALEYLKQGDFCGACTYATLAAEDTAKLKAFDAVSEILYC